MNRITVSMLLFSAASFAYGQSTPATAGAGNVSAADKKFMMMAAQSDLAEIQVGNLALQKSTNDQVKTLAQRLVDDHTKSSTAMKQLAQQKGVTLPADTDAKHKALASKLEGESGSKFDKDFLDANSADHHKVIKAFEEESTKGSDPDVKAFATQFLPPIQEHSKMIDQDKSSAK
jgi:putative membrane protein